MQKELNDLVVKTKRYQEMGVDVSDIDYDNIELSSRELKIQKVIFGEDHPLMEKFDKEVKENKALINEYKKLGFNINGASIYMKQDALISLLKSKI